MSPETSVLFLLSVPDALKTALLASASLLIYTPQNEHFGIVPLEAMLARVPVLAANEGGPLETVVEGETGWLRDVRRPEQWTEILQKVLLLLQGGNGQRLLQNMGVSGRERVVGVFSKEAMALSLDASLGQLKTTTTTSRFEKNKNSAGTTRIMDWVLVAVGITVAACLLGWSMTELLYFAMEREKEVHARAAAMAAAAGTTPVHTILRRTRQEL